jgi:hypothetical protein
MWHICPSVCAAYVQIAVQLACSVGFPVRAVREIRVLIP